MNDAGLVIFLIQFSIQRMKFKDNFLKVVVIGMELYPGRISRAAQEQWVLWSGQYK
jgi:hypothetical protein